MNFAHNQKILFILNTRSGNHSIDWEKEIKTYFESLNVSIEIYKLEEDCDKKEISEKITSFNPDKVVAVGGDGTISLVAECLLSKNIPLCILPAGSANGMAREFGIGEKPAEALPVIVEGVVKKIHALKVNGKLCLHLSDIGFNAQMIEKFQNEDNRGIWGYFSASLKVARYIFKKNPMQISLTVDDLKVSRKAGMVVIANATKYGSGAIINPTGNLEDEWFEVIVLKKFSILEIFKMLISHTSFNQQKTEIFKAKSLKMRLSKNMHFQVDGEYLGKVNEIEAKIIPAALQVVVPA